MERTQVREWIDAYERAWRTPGTDALGLIFSDDVSYLQGPFRTPVVGLADVARMWDAERDGPDEVFEMDSEVVAVDGDTAVVRVEVRYSNPTREKYRDLWIMHFDADGRCDRYEEWPFRPQAGDA